jgi:uncharacterized protein with PhoU and TrkA domain
MQSEKDIGEELFLEMKDTSELMVDLAYSALLYNNKKIAQEVYNLEERMDKLNQRLQRHAVTTVSKTNADKALALIQLAGSVEVIADSAREIADVVLRDIPLHPILKMSIRASDVIITRVEVSKKSILAGKRLGETRLASETGMWVIALRRGEKWIYGPDENTLVKSGDVLFARGPEDGAAVLSRAASGKLTKF